MAESSMSIDDRIHCSSSDRDLSHFLVASCTRLCIVNVSVVAAEMKE
jgi:hypothetical protein